MEMRVAQLEADMKDVRAILTRLEPKIIEVHAKMATKDDVIKVKDDLAKVAERVAKLEGAIHKLPTTLQLILFVVAVLEIAGITRYLGA